MGYYKQQEVEQQGEATPPPKRAVEHVVLHETRRSQRSRPQRDTLVTVWVPLTMVVMFVAGYGLGVLA